MRAGLIAALAAQAGLVGGSMAVGMNLAWVNTWSGAYPFSNLMYSAGPWAQVTGSGSYSQDQGLLTASVGTDEFRAYISDLGVGLPSGTYTVLNPTGATVAVGNFTTPTSFHAWTSATEFTFTYNAEASGFLGMWVRGSLGNGSGNLAVILPGHLSSWQSGNVWNSDFLSFQQQLGARVLRTMDWTNASGNFEVNWSDRTSPSKINLFNPLSGGGGDVSTVPWEFICDLAGRLSADPWICVPTRATSDYVTQLGALLSAQMPAGRVVYVEHGNEIWNYAFPWGDGTGWTAYLNNTRRTATLTDAAAGIWTLAGHGLTNAENVRCFVARENLLAANGNIVNIDYRTRGNWRGSIRVLSADTFKLNDAAALGGSDVTGLNAARHSKLVFVRESEGADAVNQRYADQTLRNAALLNAQIARSRVKHVLAVQASNALTTSQRMAVSGVPAAIDYIALAPYWGGDWWGVAGDIASGQITPRAWSNVARTIHMGVYAAGSTPTDAQVIAGTGAIAKVAVTTSGGTGYTNGSALTGLTNGTAYRLCSVLVSGSSGYTYQIRADFTASATTSTVYGTDSYAHQYFRNCRDIDGSVGGGYTSHSAVAQGIPLIMYETGLHFHEVAPSNVATWLAGYQESDEFAAAIRTSMYESAASGYKLACYYGDALGTTFAVADSYRDTTDKRFLELASFGGRVPVRRTLTVDDIEAEGIVSEPAYPAVAYTLPAGRTYTLLTQTTQWDVSGLSLRLLNGSGITWTTENPVTLKLLADDGFTQDVFTVSIVLGGLIPMPGTGPVAAPTLTGSPSLLASWDFADDSTVTESGGYIDAVAGSDGTTRTLTASGSTRPARTTIAGRKCAVADGVDDYLTTSSAINFGSSGVAVTLVLIFGTDAPPPTSVAHFYMEVGEVGASVSASRSMILVSQTDGIVGGRFDNSAVQSRATRATPITAGYHLAIASAPAGSGQAVLYEDGRTVTTASTSSSYQTGMSGIATLFAARTSSGVQRPASGRIWRALIYSGQLNATQCEEIAVWATTNYGTANNA